MNERPILFSAPMVRALLDGSKTQTRRVVKPTPIDDLRFCGGAYIAHKNGGDVAVEAPHINQYCPYGQPGDRLWVRETFSPIYPQDPAYNGGQPIEYDYAATYKHCDRLGDTIGIKKVYKPSIHMPRAASRITLEIVSVRVERLQDISEVDCRAEGCAGGHGSTPGYQYNATPREHYFSLWEQINGDGSWDVNPWVWVVEFKVAKP